MESSYVLTRTVGSYSGGTRIDVLNRTKSNTVFIQVKCKDREVLEVSLDDVTELRPRTATVDIETQEKNRQKKLVNRLARQAQQLGIY